MQNKIYNYNNIEEKDINNKVIRVKALLVNSNNEVLLGLSHDTYQFIGGHIEENEKEGNFKLLYIPLDEIEDIFRENEKISSRVKTIALENLEAMEYFKRSSFSHEI